MKRLVLATMLLVGCASQSPKVVEGTSIQLGAYIPWEGNLYGVELISYVNGIVVKTPTNMCYEVQRTSSTTNDWLWGMMKSVESTDTTVKLK